MQPEPNAVQSNFRLSSFYPSPRRARLAGTLGLFVLIFFLLLQSNLVPDPASFAHPLRRPDESLSIDSDDDWGRFAYGQYATDDKYLCNSVMIFEALHRLGSKADRLLLYPASMMPDPTVAEVETNDAKLLVKARDKYNVRLEPIQLQYRSDVADPTWAKSFTKLLAFNQTRYSRVLSLDSDAVVLQPMDELFLLPPSPVAMPRAYWMYPDNKILSSQVMLVQPSAVEFDRVMKRMADGGSNDYDMEIVNALYEDSAIIIPHRPYDMLTAEFRGRDHKWYLGSDREVFDPIAALKEAKFVHFSDWPVPKPWLPMSDAIREEKQPKCETAEDGSEDCTNQRIWNDLYTDFAERRNVGSLPPS